ncbi:MAG: ABC transporter ATP-binding protein [Clostridiales bacterium]|nr:ABC transporter ATP-binding protein [Clostridiales bacterium]
MAENKHVHRLSAKELRAIAKENSKTIKHYEKLKKRKYIPESEYVTEMKDEKNVLEVENLHTYFFTDVGVVKAVNNVSFNIPQGATVGIVGESGCGKSVTSLSIMGLVQGPTGQVVDGEIRFKTEVLKTDENGKYIPVYELDENGEKIVESVRVDKKTGAEIVQYKQKRDETGAFVFEKEPKVYNLVKAPKSEMSKIRGREVAMIFQEPMTSLNPVFTIGQQLDEVYLLHNPGVTKEGAKARTYEMLKLVGIIPENVYTRYPHELSGGMRQRVVIAMALTCNPRLIIGDEPTTALDVTIQAQILELLRDIKTKINGSIVLITHDLGVIAEMADYVVVMYAGKVIETGTVMEIFKNPLHPYTIGLQKSKPVINQSKERLYSIPGNVPNPIEMPTHCYFKDRCDRACDKCSGEYPGYVQVSPTHKVACYLYNEEAKHEHE